MWKALLVASLWMPVADAATVCRVISTEQVAETYSATQPDGVCVRNLTSAGIPVADIEQLTVDEAERTTRLASWQDHPNNPDKEKRRLEKEAHDQAESATRAKLGLTVAEFQQLKRAMER